MPFQRLLTLTASLAFAILSLSTANAQPARQNVEFFERKIRPLLAENCYECHGEKKQKGGLRLDSVAAIKAGGDTGPALVAGDATESRLLVAVSYEDPDLKMPPKTQLNGDQVKLLREWITAGAPMPEPSPTDATASARSSGFQITDEHRRHWAFQAIQRPEVPSVKNTAWVRNPIDAFVLAGLEAKGLSPNPAAESSELIRRATYNVTGLPPLSQTSPVSPTSSDDAWAAFVDDLLDSPHYGESWARHWLDLVRYAESNSYERDNPKPHVWRYRDYVIRAFNSDKPYDRFIREQLAGDELPDGDNDSLIATGFYRLGIWDDEPADRELARYDSLDDVIVTTGQVFLGLTLDCARCHNHKIDPISQSDYYQFLAFFQNINHFKNGGPTDEAVLVDDKASDSDAARYKALIEQLSKKPDKENEAKGDKALVVTESGPNAPETFVLLRGNPAAHGDQVEPGFPSVLGFATPEMVSPKNPSRSCGRRLTLANWIASPANQLTARVMVNRIWQHQFGRGIVRSPNDFGLQGDRPTHPELLDWLASEFIASGWSVKKIQRLIMNSSTYRMSSRGQSDALAVDVENNLFWRYNMRRLTGEEIRDSLLAVNGTLNPALFGPSIYVEIPKAVLATQSVPGKNWGESSPEEQARRSIYIHVKRSLLVPILEGFDLAETDRTTPVRFASVQPTQALGMMNSDFTNAQAKLFADRLRREHAGNSEAQVRLGLSLVTAREPNAAEVQAGVDLLRTLIDREKIPADTALDYLCLMLFNLNEFIYLD